MRYEVDVNGTRRQVTLERRDGHVIVSTGGREWLVDGASVGPHTLSLLVEQVRLKPESNPDLVRLKPDPTDTPVSIDPVRSGFSRTSSASDVGSRFSRTSSASDVGSGFSRTSSASDVGSGFSRTLNVFSHELSIATDPVSGQFVFGIRGVPVVAGLSAGRRWGSKDDSDAGSGPQRIVAPMPGKIVRILARPGDLVQHRQPIVVVEAMKMENELRAARDGTVVEMLVQEGQSVEAGALLAIVAQK